MSKSNEFRVRAVERFVVTHFQEDPALGNSCRQIGEYPNLEQAEIVGRALTATVPGATFQTMFVRPEPVAIYYAYSREQAEALGAASRAFDADNGVVSGCTSAG